jgi:hypothetical protein
LGNILGLAGDFGLTCVGLLVLLIEEEDNTSVNLRFSLAMQAVSHQDQPGCRSKRLLAGLLAKSDIAGILCLHILSKQFRNRCS